MHDLKFIYFDLGKVLLDFDVEVMFRQMAEVAGIAPQRVREVVIESGLQHQYELGRISSREFYEAFCRESGTRPGYDALARAGSAIFTLHLPVLPIVTRLRHCGWRLGILSNTCEYHWEFCTRRFRWLGELFDVHALSFRLQACKPEAAIFQRAAALAGCQPREIFFTDDTPGHVAAAQSAGFDAVVFTGAPPLAAALRARGVRFAY